MATFLFIFGLFKQNNTILTTNQSSIRCWDSNSLWNVTRHIRIKQFENKFPSSYAASQTLHNNILIALKIVQLNVKISHGLAMRQNGKKWETDGSADRDKTQKLCFTVELIVLLD